MLTFSRLEEAKTVKDRGKGMGTEEKGENSREGCHMCWGRRDSFIYEVPSLCGGFNSLYFHNQLNEMLSPLSGMEREVLVIKWVV